MRDLWTAATIGWLAFGAAVYCGIPVWFDWPSLTHPFDASDAGVLTAFAVFQVLRRSGRSNPND